MSTQTYVTIPSQLLNEKISIRAIRLWLLLTQSCTAGSVELWVRQATLAEQLAQKPKPEPKEDRTQKAIRLLREELSIPVKEEDLNPRAKQFLSVLGETWRTRFKQLDGKEGRPYFEACLQKYTTEDKDSWMYGKSRHTAEFVEACLKTVTERFC